MLTFQKAVTFTLIRKNNMQNLYTLGSFSSYFSVLWEGATGHCAWQNLLAQGCPDGLWPAAPAEGQGELQRSPHRERCGQLKTLETHVCGFEGRLIAYYQGHWEPLLPSILIVGWVFKPTRSNTFWVLLLQDLYVFYQSVSSNAYNTNLHALTKLDDSFWVAQFFSHPVTVSETSSLPETKMCLLITQDVQFTLYLG